MPKVGKKRFPYTPEGIRQAQEEARRTGKPVEEVAERKKLVRKPRKKRG